MLNIYVEKSFLAMFLPTYDHQYPANLRQKKLNDTRDNALNPVREPQQNKYPLSTRRLGADEFSEERDVFLLKRG